MRIAFIEPIGIPVEECRAALPGHDIRELDSRGWTDDRLIAEIGDTEVVALTNRPLSGAVIDAIPSLGLIAVAFTGIDHVDLKAARARGVQVENAAGYADTSVAELVIGLMVCLARDIPRNDRAIRDGGITNTGSELRGKTVGIIGDGAIGRAVAELTTAMGMKPVLHGLTTGTRLEDVVAASDFVTLHVPLNPGTRDMFSKEQFARMKPTAFLINCARGPIVNAADLLDTLEAGRIAGAALDVFDVEPPLPRDSPLLRSSRVIATPHLGFNTWEALQRKGSETLQHIASYAAAHPG